MSVICPILPDIILVGVERIFRFVKANEVNLMEYELEASLCNIIKTDNT